MNVLYPEDYQPGERYPVLYLLHGAAGNHRDWQTIGAVERVVDQARTEHDLPPFLVVMPDAGEFGFYSDWYGVDVDGHNGSGPAPAWTTYHIDELIPWVDAHLPTIPERRARAVAGLSMGGFGAMTYATRFPDLFAAAGSFSGAVNPSYGYPAGNAFITGASAPFTGRGFDQCIWGEFATQEVRWLATDPTYLAGNLEGAGLELYVASGGGDAERPQGLVTDPVEEAIYLMSQAFVDALDEHAVEVTEDFYAEGGHDWQYWQRDLERFVPMMVETFLDEPTAAPATFDFRSAASEFSVWDWSFRLDRDVTEFLYLEDVSDQGLTAVGSGRLEVTTPATYRPLGTYRITREDLGESIEVTADPTGTLRFPVELGASHPTQQFVFDGAVTDGWTRAVVTIDRVAAAPPR